MKFGVFFPFQIPRPWRDGDEQRAFDEALAQVELADRIGIQYCWAQEHDFLEEYSHSSAPEVYLGAFSQKTKRIKIGHGIIHMPPGFNHPARVAARMAALDILSDGRAQWGAGEGTTRVELAGYQVPYVEKRAMWEEAVHECARMMGPERYSGYEGKFFAMGAADVVPKPVQIPHPPLWTACTSRASLRSAARCGLGALTFAFMDAKEAKFWVEEYYETFQNECTPLGRAVNPNVAMLSQFMCHEDRSVALARGLEGAKFFAYGLAHYIRNGAHTPGRTQLWDEFIKGPPIESMGGLLGLGDPSEIREHFLSFEEAGLDQLILLHQAGNYEHEHIMSSLSLFGGEVLPAFIERDRVREQARQQELAPHIERIMERVGHFRSEPDAARVS